MKNNTYLTLEAQLNRLARHNRQGSYRTKERYYMAMKRFCHFLANNYHLQKLSNISGKHLVAYVLWMQEKGLSASTIKTDLAAIRFFHDKISNPKYRAFFHKKAAMIKWDQVEELIGHAPGGVCPFGIKEGVKVYLDESLWRFKTVYAAAGEPNATIALSPEELFEASNALERIDVCKLPFEE